MHSENSSTNSHSPRLEKIVCLKRAGGSLKNVCFRQLKGIYISCNYIQDKFITTIQRFIFQSTFYDIFWVLLQPILITGDGGGTGSPTNVYWTEISVLKKFVHDCNYS